MSNRDAALVQIRDLKEQLQGLSPKTETHKRLSAELDALYRREGNRESAPMRKVPIKKPYNLQTH